MVVTERGELAARLLIPSVFFTGAAGLVYQVAWQRYLGRLLGNDTAATAVILAVFLGGLAVGYRVFGALSARVARPFRLYGLVEAGIGVWGLSFPLLFRLVEQATASLSFAPGPALVIQGSLAAMALIGPPTILMGGTLPLLTRGLSPSLNQATAVHARVYAINTAGAFLGTLAAGFFLTPELGLPATVRVAAAVNLAACLPFFLARESRPQGHDGIRPAPSVRPVKPAMAKPAAAEPAPGPAGTFSPALLCLVAFINGLAFMTLENVLIRVANLTLGSSSYAFSLVVAAFILAIAVGGALAARPRHTARALFLNQAGALLLLLCLYLTLDAWPYLAHILRLEFPRTMPGFYGFHLAILAALLVLIGPPAAFLGATAPLLFHELKRSLSDVGRHSGQILSFNTLGNLTGSLLGGMALYAVLGIPGIFLTAAALVALSAALTAKPLSRPTRAAAWLAVPVLLACLADPPFFAARRFAIGSFRFPAALPSSYAGPEAFHDEVLTNVDILFQKDGVAGTVAVASQREGLGDWSHDRAIMVNGRSDSAALQDAPTVRLIAHIPALLAEKRERVMIVGLGTGVTAGEFTRYPDVGRIDVAEISPTVVEALPFFKAFTSGLAEDPRFALHQGDALRILGRSAETWDIIVSEPSSPWVTGVDMLFTREFYRLVRDRLSPGGLFAQWMHLHNAGREPPAMVIRTLLEAFPHVRVFMTQGRDILAVASERALTAADAARGTLLALDNDKVRTSLSEIGLEHPDALWLRELWNSAAPLSRPVSEPSSGAAPEPDRDDIQTMDHPRLHYLAGQNQFLGRSADLTFLFGPATADHAASFLLTGQPAWAPFPFPPPATDALLRSSWDVSMGLPKLLPPALSLLRLAHMANPSLYPLDVDDPDFRPELVLLATRPRPDPALLAKAGLTDLPAAEQARIVENAALAARNWVFPFPVAGVEALRKRAETGSDGP